MMNIQQNPEAIERRRTQNRIAQRKHGQRRAQVLWDYQQNDRRGKEGNTENYDQDHQRERGGGDHDHFSNSKKRCTNCQPKRIIKSSHQSSPEDKPAVSTNQPCRVSFTPASSLDENLKISAVKDENRAASSPFILQANRVSPNFPNNDNQYYLHATASPVDDDYFLGGMLESTDYSGTTDNQNRTASSQNQSLDTVAISVDDVNNLTTHVRSASHHSSGSKDFQSANPYVTPSCPAIFTTLASPPMSEDGPPAYTSHLVRKHHKGKTALHLCAERGNNNIVKLLLACGAAMDVQDSFGCTALHYAAKNAHYEVMRTLLQGGADTEISNCEGYSVLHVAAEVGSEDIIALLAQEGADLNSRVGIEEY